MSLCLCSWASESGSSLSGKAPGASTMPTSCKIWVSSGLLAFVPRSMAKSGPCLWFLLALSLTMLFSKLFLLVWELFRTCEALYRFRWFTVGTFYLIGSLASSNVLFMRWMRWSSSRYFLLRSWIRAWAACWAVVELVVTEAVVVNPESPMSPDGIL